MAEPTSDQARFGQADFDRRVFLQATAAMAATAAFPALAETTAVSPSGETLVQQLHGSLTDAQKQAICFPFDHALRQEVDNNWHIVKDRVGTLFNPDQRDLIKQIFVSLHSESFAAKALQQVEHDNKKGIEDCAVALFGEPQSGKFEFVFTGRHVTRRCDGDSVEGQAFGGPIFYGHAAKSFNEGPAHEGNVYWHQAMSANKVFEALDGKQREIALRRDAREEDGLNTVKLSSDPDALHGLCVADMTGDQKQLVRDTLKDLLAMFRPKDVSESMKLIESTGGIEPLHMAFYENMDIGDDGVWDVWQLQSPTMIWHFRGKPHVHTWVRIQNAPDCGC